MRACFGDRLDDARALVLLTPPQLFLQSFEPAGGHRHLVHFNRPFIPWFRAARLLPDAARQKKKTVQQPWRRNRSQLNLCQYSKPARDFTSKMTAGQASTKAAGNGGGGMILPTAHCLQPIACCLPFPFHRSVIGRALHLPLAP
jgi:hypothetical protein